MDAPAPNIPHHGPDLFSKVGPLPAWAWGAVVVGGYIVYQHMHSGVPPQALDNPMETGSDPYADGATSGGLPSIDPSTAGYNYQDVLSGSYEGTTTGSGTRYSTNQQWAISVISNLTSMGFSASLVTTAVSKYLAGQALTSSESQAINAAITNFGPPPLPLPVTSTPTPAPTVPKPVAKPVAAPPKLRYVVRPGDTIWTVSAKYHITATQLLTLNPTINRTTHRLIPGTSIRVGL